MGDIINLEEGLIWLPSHVLEEALFDHPNTQKLQQHKTKQHRRTASPADNLPLNGRANGCRVQPKQKHQSNKWQKKGDERMQAFFLASRPATSGTGVFLPATSTTASIKKPHYASVLLPPRVIQALNLNVHSLGLQVSPRSDGENGWRKKNIVNGNGDVNPISSPEISLPKEWTY